MTTVDNVVGVVPDRPALGKIVLVAASAAMGGFLFGFDTAVINGAVDAVKTWSGVSSALLGFSVASALLGSAIGAWFAGPLADAYGRIMVMILAAAIFFVSSIGTGLATGIGMLTAFRILGGTAIGAASVIAPAYIAEVSPAEFRGRLGSLQQLAIVFGIFVALLIDYALAKTAGGPDKPLWFGWEAWRWMFISAALPALVYALLALMIPESPRYLVRKNRFVEAANVLRRFVGNNPPPEEKIAEIREPAEPEGSGGAVLRPAADRLGRHPAVGVPAVRRHQRHLLLFLDAVACGRLHAERLARHHGLHVGHQYRRDAGGDRARRQASPGHRLERHGRDARDDGLHLRDVAARSDDPPTRFVPNGRPHRDRRRKPLCCLLRHELGPGGLGAARRDVQQPHPRLRARGRRGGPMGRDLHRVADLPDARRPRPTASMR